MKEIDCRGQACPQPVIRTKQALEEIKEGDFIIIVNDPSSSENVKRFVLSQGGSVTEEKKGNDIYLHIRKSAPGADAKILCRSEKIVVYMSSNVVGIGDEALGSVLARAFLKTLLDIDPKPSRMIFINSGVRLTSEGSEVLESLKALSEKGVEILSCGTCLDFYGLKEKLKIGIVTNMFEIAKSLLEADRIIRP